MAGRQSGTRGQSRVRASVLVAWLLLAACAGALLWDLVRLPDMYAFPRPTRAIEIGDAAEDIGRARAVNAVVGDAVQRETEYVGGQIDVLLVPEDLASLLDVDADVFAGREQATLDRRLMRPFIGVMPKVGDYDPVLTREQVAEFRAPDGEHVVHRYPLGVYTVAHDRPSDSASVYTDPTHSEVWIIFEPSPPESAP
ncbi:MAG: hypothetical protein OEV43_07850 [Coriobacteriia bacterium]|nr:hypothetical protein [Coriobacteriia bacterium]